jgi:hypothetical protein
MEGARDLDLERPSIFHRAAEPRRAEASATYRGINAKAQRRKKREGARRRKER